MSKKNTTKELLNYAEKAIGIEKIVLKNGKEIYINNFPHILITNLGKICKDKNEVIDVKMILSNDKDCLIFAQATYDLSKALMDDYIKKNKLADTLKSQHKDILNFEEKVYFDE